MRYDDVGKLSTAFRREAAPHEVHMLQSKSLSKFMADVEEH